MCGIFAYSGPKNNAPELVIEGLKRLEYRGYDSWGIAYKRQSGEIIVHKEVGKIGEISDKTVKNFELSNLAISHSRWATHGDVNEKNAHPHFSGDKEIVLVHNGIFENYLEVKKRLEKKGHKFISKTDTEVIAHLIEEYSRNHKFLDSIKLAIKEIEGRYAIVVLNKWTDELIAARKGSPLIIGVGKEKNEYYIASDIPAFLPYTKDVMYLDDNQLVRIERNKIEFTDLAKNELIEKRIIKIDWDAESAEKGDYGTERNTH